MPSQVPKFYAVANGRQTGVFNSWAEARASVEGFSGAKHKSFATMGEAMTYLATAAPAAPAAAAAAAVGGGANGKEEGGEGPFYAVAVGRQAGIFNDWPTAHASVNGFPGALHQRFPTRAQATAFLEAHAAACARSGTVRRQQKKPAAPAAPPAAEEPRRQPRRQQKKPAAMSMMVVVVLVVATAVAVTLVFPW